MNRTQFKIVAIGCWVAALAIVAAHAKESYREPWLTWLGMWFVRTRGAVGSGPVGGLWVILLAALGAVAWAAQGNRRRPPPTIDYHADLVDEKRVEGLPPREPPKAYEAADAETPRPEPEEDEEHEEEEEPDEDLTGKLFNENDVDEDAATERPAELEERRTRIMERVHARIREAGTERDRMILALLEKGRSPAEAVSELGLSWSAWEALRRKMERWARK